MDIKVNLNLLEDQITMCDLYAHHAGNYYTSAMFEGISNLLSNICYALENGQKIDFTIVEE